MDRNLVVTGIPRSGTSYVCALLNRIENTVLVNEPVEALQYLRNDSSHSMGEYYRDTRRAILDGRPIQNKIVNGRFIEDTHERDVRNYYEPEVRDASFVFGTKNTFVYLMALEKISRQLPGAVTLATVRHPYDVVASWKRVSFPHLQQANPAFFADYADAAGREGIARICGTRRLEDRYALMWDFLARQILERAGSLIMVKYEDFVVRPGGLVTAVYEALGAGRPDVGGLNGSEARAGRNALGPAEIESLRAHCADTAAQLGYAL